MSSFGTNTNLYFDVLFTSINLRKFGVSNVGVNKMGFRGFDPWQLNPSAGRTMQWENTKCWKSLAMFGYRNVIVT